MSRRYILEVFDSRNTSTSREIEQANIEMARHFAAHTSRRNPYPVVLREIEAQSREGAAGFGTRAEYRGAFEQYENGERTEWSAEPLE